MNTRVDETAMAADCCARPRKPALAKFYNRARILPAVIGLLALALRLYRVGAESVGYDEAFSLSFAAEPLPSMMQDLVRDFVHPPLHYLVLTAWMKVFGFGVMQARLLSVVCGTLAVIVLYALAGRLFGRMTAAVAALLLAISELGVIFSQEARPYAQFLLLFLCSSYLFVRAIQAGSRRCWWLFVVTAILMIYTHYYGFLVLAALGLWMLLFRRSNTLPLKWIAGGLVAGIVCYAPWVASGIVREMGASSRTASGVQPYWATHWFTFFSATTVFGNGKPADLMRTSPWWAYAASTVLFFVPALLALKELKAKDRTLWEGIALFAILYALPLVAATVLGLLFHVQYHVRYVAFCAAPYYVLVARGIAGLRPRIAAAFIVLLVTYSAASGLRASYVVPRKENFRDAVKYVRQEYHDGDCTVFVPFGTRQWNISGGTPLAVRTITLDTLESRNGGLPPGVAYRLGYEWQPLGRRARRNCTAAVDAYIFESRRKTILLGKRWLVRKEIGRDSNPF